MATEDPRPRFARESLSASAAVTPLPELTSPSSLPPARRVGTARTSGSGREQS